MASTGPVTISSCFDAGNAEVVGFSDVTVRLKIKADPYTVLEKKTHMQWFAFRATPSSAATTKVKYELVNAGDVSFPDAWPGSEVCYSLDKKTWGRVKSTAYDGETKVLSWTFDHAASPSGAGVYFAYFDLYPYERQLELVAKCAAVGATVRSIGQTLDGRELECVEVGNGPLHAWVIHRQHPGESQASFFAEGLLTRLLGLGHASGARDGLVIQLLRQVTFHVVPNMNPDGSVRGHLRVNASGANLNREWCTTGEYVAPTKERSPEVHAALAAMDRTGVDFFADVHGDEELPFSFIAGCEGLSIWGPRIKALQAAFLAAYARSNPDMQRRFGYEADAPLSSNLAICSNQIAQRFNCLGFTLEMPFKDCASNVGEGGPFQGERCAALGASLLDGLAYVVASLRGVDEPSFPLADDQYVAPIEDPKQIAAWIAEQRAVDVSGVAAGVGAMAVGAAGGGGDVDYGAHLKIHIDAAVNKTLAKMPADPFKAIQQVLFQASLDGSTPAATAVSPTPEQAAYMAEYRVQDCIERCLLKMKKRLTAGPLEGVKFLVSDAGDFFTEESKKLKAAGGKWGDLTMTAEELAAKDKADAKAKRDKEAKAEAERDANDAANLERQKAMEADGKQVKGGLHKFDASEVDAYGGEGTADDLMDAFGF